MEVNSNEAIRVAVQQGAGVAFLPPSAVQREIADGALVATSVAGITCSLHPWMKAHVLATDNPYVAVTDEYGYFQIANLPAGEEIKFRLWHERAGGSGGGLAAKPEWTEGRFRVTIPPGGSVNLGEIRVAASSFGF